MWLLSFFFDASARLGPCQKLMLGWAIGQLSTFPLLFVHTEIFCYDFEHRISGSHYAKITPWGLFECQLSCRYDYRCYSFEIKFGSICFLHSKSFAFKVSSNWRWTAGPKECD